MNKIKKITALFCAILIVMSLAAGCSNTKNPTYDNYSYGLTSDGYYEGLESCPIQLPDFTSMKFVDDEILEWGLNYANSLGQSDLKTIDDYVYLYGKEFLTTLGVAKKDQVEEGDIVSASLTFHVDGQKLDDYSSTRNYEASSKGDVIVSSLIGRKTKEYYAVEYTFPNDDPYYPSKVALVNIVINSIDMSDPIKDDVIQSNLEKINEHIKNVKNAETFLIALKPALAKAILTGFIEDYIQNKIDVEIPKKFVDCELYRLKYRLSKIGYTYEQYLQAANLTEQEVVSSYELIAKENLVCMLVFKNLNYQITDEQMKEYYGENLEYITQEHGVPYMKLSMLRGAAIEVIAEQVAIVSANGEIIKDHNPTPNIGTYKPNETTPTSTSG